MKRVLWSVLGLLLLTTVPASASIFLADYLGYDYTWPVPNDFTTPGQDYDAIGVITTINPAFHVVDNAFEYTFHIHSGTLTGADTLGNFGIYHFDSGDAAFGILRDNTATGTTGDYGVNPPNATAPSTFTDGTLLFGGSMPTLMITVDLTTGDGSLSGTIDFDSGSEVPNIPPDQLNGWTFAGLGAGFPGVPEGYIWQVDGEVYLPDPTETQETNWGGVKSLFR
jgi:hypothetical protein